MVDAEDLKSKETLVYDKLEDNRVQCGVCPRKCKIGEDETGCCRTRKNYDGTLYSMVYGKAVSSALDPIEKKPFFNFAPGSRTFSLATVGCNMRCDFCQNYGISHGWNEIKGEKLMPEDVVRKAKGYQCQGVAYTYTEPTVFLEYALETMTEAETELYNVFVSNGYMTKETVEKIGPHLDAINVDIKGDVNFYREHCQIKDPQPIYDALKELKKHDVWIEITNLIIPGENDSNYHIEKTVDWVRENLGRETPIHFSRFRPHLEMKKTPPTPIDTLERAVDVAYKKGMFYAYAGNVTGHEKESTFCPGCGQVVIKRKGFEITEFKLDRNLKCPHCGREVHIKGRNWIPDNLFKDS